MRRVSGSSGGRTRTLDFMIMNYYFFIPAGFRGNSYQHLTGSRHPIVWSCMPSLSFWRCHHNLNQEITVYMGVDHLHCQINQ